MCIWFKFKTHWEWRWQTKIERGINITPNLTTPVFWGRASIARQLSPAQMYPLQLLSSGVKKTGIKVDIPNLLYCVKVGWAPTRWTKTGIAEKRPSVDYWVLSTVTAVSVVWFQHFSLPVPSKGRKVTWLAMVFTIFQQTFRHGPRNIKIDHIMSCIYRAPYIRDM